VGLNWSDLFSAGNSLTPAVFWLSRPRGAMGATTSLTEALGPGREAAASLGVFLAMTLMTIQFWTLVDLAGPLLLTLIAQFPLALLINLVLVFPLLGGTDAAAVIAAGFSGFSLGSTPTAMANMTAVTQRFGPSAKALIVLPLVSALFMDLLNAVLIPLFLPRL
jgi:ESS family glutamate:Na+ symporter